MRRVPRVDVSGYIWLVLVLGGLMGIFAILTSKALKEGQFIGIMVYLILGSLYPPIGVPLGALIVFAMAFRGGLTALGAWLSQVGGRTSTGASPSLPLGPQVQPVQIAADYQPFPPSITNVYNYNSGQGVA